MALRRRESPGRQRRQLALRARRTKFAVQAGLEERHDPDWTSGRNHRLSCQSGRDRGKRPLHHVAGRAGIVQWRFRSRFDSPKMKNEVRPGTQTPLSRNCADKSFVFEGAVSCVFWRWPAGQLWILLGKGGVAAPSK